MKLMIFEIHGAEVLRMPISEMGIGEKFVIRDEISLDYGVHPEEVKTRVVRVKD